MREGATSRLYRGQVRVRESGSGVAAINVVRLQQYLYGVVGAEVPGGWTKAAYAAQAVAARSYALLMRHNARASPHAVGHLRHHLPGLRRRGVGIGVAKPSGRRHRRQVPQLRRSPGVDDVLLRRRRLHRRGVAAVPGRQAGPLRRCRHRSRELGPCLADVGDGEDHRGELAAARPPRLPSSWPPGTVSGAGADE